MIVEFLLCVLLISNAYSISIDCSNIINLAQGLGIMTQQPTIWTELLTDCCITNGVSCVSQRVSQINWSSMTLNGFLNGTALPSGLQELDLYSNQLTGPLPSSWPNGLQILNLNSNRLSGFLPRSWPSNLQIVYLYSNQLTGSVSSTWPNGLLQLNLGSNQLTGSIPSTWPNGLQQLNLGVNSLDGHIPSIWPSNLQELDLYSNQLTGSIPGSWPNGLQQLNLGANQLTGSIPSTWPNTLQALYLYSNYLSGDISSLPSTLVDLCLGYPGDSIYNQFTGSLVLNQPQHLYIYNNLITDVIVYNASLLTGNCDLSYNPLLGDPHISNLTMCVQNGLYSVLQSITKTQSIASGFQTKLTSLSKSLKFR